MHERELPGSPDIVLPRYETAIQVRGCFWHGHGCKKTMLPSTNVTYWREKLSATKQRDKRNDQLLLSDGWLLFVVWEYSIEKENDLNVVVEKIISEINRGSHKKIVECEREGK